MIKIKLNLTILLIFSNFTVLAQDTSPAGRNLFDVLRERTEIINERIEDHGYKINTLENAKNKNLNNTDNFQLRDPFNLSDDLNSNIHGNQVSPSTFLPNSNQQKIPEIKLKGVINTNPKAPHELLALLEVGKKEVYMVRTGDEISYDPAQPSSAIKIITISRLSVTVQVGSLGNVLIVR